MTGCGHRICWLLTKCTIVLRLTVDFRCRIEVDQTMLLADTYQSSVTGTATRYSMLLSTF